MNKLKNSKLLSICMCIAAFCLGWLGFTVNKSFELAQQVKDLNTQLAQKERALQLSEGCYQGLLQIIHDKGLVREAIFEVERQGNPTKSTNFEWDKMSTNIDTVYGSYEVTFKKLDKPKKQTKQEAIGYSQLYISNYGDVSFVPATASTPLAIYKLGK